MVIFRRRVAGLSAAALAKFVGRASRAAGLSGGINVLVTGNGELQTLNRRFRGKTVATDVLSFPAGFGNGFAGDVAVSAEIASRNAKRPGHSAVEEIKILALHGILHLAGYDHERDGGEMAAREVQLRKSLGLPSGLIERHGQTPKRMTAKMMQGTRRGKVGERRSAYVGEGADKHAPLGKPGAGRSPRATPR